MRRSEVLEIVEVAVTTPDLPDFADLDGLTVEELAAVHGVLSAIKSATYRVEGQVKRRLAEALGVKGWAKLGKWVYRVNPKRSWQVRPEREGDFFHEIHKRDAARRVFNANDARIGALRELFTDYVDTETGELGLSVFIEETEGEVEVTVQPADHERVPKFIREAQEGVYPRLTNG